MTALRLHTIIGLVRQAAMLTRDELAPGSIWVTLHVDDEETLVQAEEVSGPASRQTVESSDGNFDVVTMRLDNSCELRFCGVRRGV